MTKYSTKLKRTLRFYNGARVPEIFQMLEPYGFSREVIIQGATLLATAANLRKKAITFEDKAPGLTTRLEEFQSLWVPVTRATLNASYPELAQAFFEGLVQRRGLEAPLGVTTFVTRLGELESGTAPWGPDGAAARQLLAERGLTQAVIDEAHALLDQWRDVPESPVLSPAETDEIERATEAAWDWYVEWSTIARAVLKRRRDLHTLGLSRRREKDAEPELAPTPTVPALSGRTQPQGAIELLGATPAV